MNAVTRDVGPAVERLEAAMLAVPQAPCAVVHRFAPGLYVREVTIPAGVFAIGHYQREPHLCVMTRGRVTLVGRDGATEEVIAPVTYIAQPGRKVGYVHEDMTWLNIYATDETDVEQLEARFLRKSDAFVGAQPGLLTYQRLEDTDDFHAALAELGFTEAEVAAQSEATHDQRPFPPGSYRVQVAPSAIHGRGLFATAPIAAGEVIAPARLAGLRTPAGRYTNHGAKPNAAMRARPDGDVDLVALRDIAGSHGGVLGEEITVDYREAVRAARASLGVLT